MPWRGPGPSAPRRGVWLAATLVALAGVPAPVVAQGGAVAATRIELLAASDPDLALHALADYRADHPESPDTDRIAAVVARALIGEGRAAEAESAIAGVDGPRSMVVHGRLLLFQGEPAAAREVLMTAAAFLHGPEATATLSLATLLGRVSDRAGALVGQVLALSDRGRTRDAIHRARSGVADLASGDRPPVLSFTAELADAAGLSADAVAMRRQVLDDHPRSQEAPGALLALANTLSETEGPAGEARDLLERLIIEYPRSALVPQARRALDRLDR